MWLIVLLMGCSWTAQAAEATVAVATNFKSAAQQLIGQYHERHPDHRISLVSGATGKLYAQILQGAPYDILLAADAHRPALLEQQGIAINGSRRTYAIGQLALLGQEPTDAQTLRTGGYRSLAMANPHLAPYGLAAQQTLEFLAIDLEKGTRVVYGENVGQAFAMVASGNAELGLVARSLLRASDQAWLIPSDHHEPIRQQSVLLRRAIDNPAATTFIEFLGSDDATKLIRSTGYLTEAS